MEEVKSLFEERTITRAVVVHIPKGRNMKRFCSWRNSTLCEKEM
ncbi:hypothetical protein [Bacillus sp. JJ722]